MLEGLELLDSLEGNLNGYSVVLIDDHTVVSSCSHSHMWHLDTCKFTLLNVLRGYAVIGHSVCSGGFGRLH